MTIGSMNMIKHQAVNEMAETVMALEALALPTPKKHTQKMVV